MIHLLALKGFINFIADTTRVCLGIFACLVCLRMKSRLLLDSRWLLVLFIGKAENSLHVHAGGSKLGISDIHGRINL